MSKNWLLEGGTFSLNESPSEKEGKCQSRVSVCGLQFALNESPSEKEGKLSFLP